MNCLKTLRLLSDLTQIELAHRAGVTLWRLNRYERGYIQLRPEEKNKIAAALEESVEKIFPELKERRR